jgi:hypothetical protein
MNPKLKIIWIDDSPERKDEAQNLEHRIDADVDFICVNKLSTEDFQKKLIELSKPDLILMDHSLDKSFSETFKTGSTTATVLHDKWQDCPIICVTGIEPDQVLSRQRLTYQKVFLISNISDRDSSILAIAEGFRILNSNKVKSIENIFEHMKAPKEEYQRLSKILPKELKESFIDPSYSLQLFKWFSSVFYSRPGFLIDRLWAATLLGFNESGFIKVEQLFEDAEYKGIFNDQSEKRWWKSLLLSKLGELVEENGLPWVLGRYLPNLGVKDYSKCHASGEEFPETVAFEDESSDSKEYAMKLKYTLPHPRFENMLFFDEIRIMKPAE